MRQANGVPFAQYFLEQWKAKEGYSPVSVQNGLLRFQRIQTIGVIALVAISVAFFGLAFFRLERNSIGPMPDVVFYCASAGVVVAGVLDAVGGMKATLCRERVRRFEDCLYDIAVRLGMPPEELARLDGEAVMSLAEEVLGMWGKGLASLRIAMDAEHLAVRVIEECLKDHHSCFWRWGLVLSARWELYASRVIL